MVIYTFWIASCLSSTILHEQAVFQEKDHPTYLDAEHYLGCVYTGLWNGSVWNRSA